MLALGLPAAEAQSVSVSTVPEGVLTYNISSTGPTQTTTYYISLPLTEDPVYSGAVSMVSASGNTTDTISVADNPAPFTTGALSPPSSSSAAYTPYFVKFLSGGQTGRVVRILANTTNSVTLDTTDNTSSPIQTTDLTTNSPFVVSAGDTFQIFPGNTLASMFGTNTTQSPLILKGGSKASADSISIYDPVQSLAVGYYFNTSTGYWSQGSSVATASNNANNTILYPYGALIITRRPNQAQTSFALMGRVAEVPLVTKTPGNNRAIYASSQYPVDMTLSQFALGSSWTTNNSSAVADSLGVWDASASRFDTYYERPDLTWRTVGSSADQSGTAVPAGSVINIDKRTAVSGNASFLQSTMPYSLN